MKKIKNFIKIFFQLIWITGASSGIGEAMVKAFNEKGASLIISSRNIKEV